MSINGLLTDIADSLRWVKKAILWFFTHSTVLGVAGTAVVGGTIVMFQNMMDSLISALDSTLAEVDGIENVVGAVDGSFLDKVNYCFPLDILATVWTLYISLWAGVQTFRLIGYFLRAGSAVAEKIPGQ